MDSIAKLKAKLCDVGPFHPGKITQQYIKCGKKNCKCQDKVHPEKHGPYYLLNYSVGKKNSTVFLKEHEVAEAKAWLDEFQTFKKVTEALIEEYVKLAKTKRWKA